MLQDPAELLGDLAAVGQVVAIAVECPATGRAKALVHEVALALVLRAHLLRRVLQEETEAAGTAAKGVPRDRQRGPGALDPAGRAPRDRSGQRSRHRRSVLSSRAPSAAVS